MDTAVGVSFIAIELTFIVLAGLATLRTGFMRLDSWIGIGGDGLQLGRAAPSWMLPDITGRMHVTPATDHWQILIFANIGIVGLPDLVCGIRNFLSSVDETELLLLSTDTPEECRATVQGLHLQTPIVPVDSGFYNRFRVRVMPYAMILNPQGIVRWQGLVNTEAQLFHMRRMAQAEDDSSV